jgi:hypothetical protein
MKTVYELKHDELNELKQSYVTEQADKRGEGISYGELADSENIPNDVIFNHYNGIVFSNDDFFCNLKGVSL